MCWQLLLGLLPPDSSKWAATAGARRRKYWDLLQRYERAERHEGTEEEAVLARQIAIDIPRTATDLPLFSQDRVRRSLTRLRSPLRTSELQWEPGPMSPSKARA